MRMLLMVILLSGCAAFDSKRPVPQIDDITIHIKLTDDLPVNTNGRAWIDAGTCYVELKRSIFPTCLPHEVLHCFGWTHAPGPNMEFCRVE